MVRIQIRGQRMRTATLHCNAAATAPSIPDLAALDNRRVGKMPVHPGEERIVTDRFVFDEK